MNKEISVILMPKGYGKATKEVRDYIHQLKERCTYLERSNNRREDEIMSLRDENVDLASKNEQLEKENKELKQPQVFIDCEDMEERYGRDLYEDYLKEKIEQLENIRKEAIEYNEHLIRDSKYHLNLGHLKKMRNILNKGDD